VRAWPSRWGVRTAPAPASPAVRPRRRSRAT
jgi:hypothetical protein